MENPFYLAGFDEGMPTTTLDLPVSTTESGTGTNWLDVVNAVGSIVLGGILISRTPKENLPKVTTQPTPTTSPRTAAPAQTGLDTQKIIQYGAIAGIIVILAILIMRTREG